MSPVSSSAFRSVLHYRTADELVRALQSFSISDSDGCLSSSREEDAKSPCSFSSSSDWQLSNYDRENSIEPTVEQEARRLLALKSFQILETAREDEFDQVAREVRDRLGVPWTVMGFVDLGRVWVKASGGSTFDATEVSRCDSFCAHAVLKREGILVVRDLALDSRFRDNPYVAGSPGFRFHVGVPLVTPDGFKLGSICVLDSKPRLQGLTLEDEAFLETKARETIDLLMARKNRIETEMKRGRCVSYASLDLPASPLLKKVCSKVDFQDPSLFAVIPKPDILRTSGEEESSGGSSLVRPLPSDPKSCDLDPDQYLAHIMKTMYDVEPTITPALKLQDFFPRITEEQVAAYSMEIVSATRENNVERLRGYLEERGRDCLDCYNRFGEGLLNLACRRGFKDIVQFLLSPPVRLNVRVHDDGGRTPLHDTCWHPTPQLDICSWILREDPSLFLVADKRGFTPFQYARKSDWPVWRQFLYDHRDEFQALANPDVLRRFQ
jgi:hypothetical protein